MDNGKKHLPWYSIPQTWDTKLVGLSLSFCIRDMLTENVNPKNVAYLTTGTKCTDPHEWLEVLNTYVDTYWHGDRRGIELAESFIKRGLIIQPRLWDAVPVGNGGAFRGYWIDQYKVPALYVKTQIWNQPDWIREPLPEWVHEALS